MVLKEEILPPNAVATAMPITVLLDAVRVFAAIFIVTAAVNLQMPLYRVYVANAGMGTAMTSLVFSAYVAGLLPTLILLGGVSDHVGRKPVLMAAVSFSLLACLIMALKPTLTSLFVARPLQGIAVGLAVGTGTAYLSERLDPWRPRTWVSAGMAALTSLGFGSGALFTGTLLLHNFRLNPPSYWIVAIAAGLGLPALLGLRGTGRRPASLVSLPILPRRFWPEYLSIAMAWAITGIVIAILPAEMHRRGLGAYSGHALFLVNLSGALVSPWARRLTAVGNLMRGYFLLPLGFAALLWGVAYGALAGLFLGAAVVGSACYGFTYYGGLNRVNSVPNNERARTVSGFFLVAYLGFGLPALLLGFLSDRIGILPTLIGFGGCLFLACLLLGLRLWSMRAWSRGKSNPHFDSSAQPTMEFVPGDSPPQ